jgi:hypothetical protein
VRQQQNSDLLNDRFGSKASALSRLPRRSMSAIAGNQTAGPAISVKEAPAVTGAYPLQVKGMGMPTTGIEETDNGPGCSRQLFDRLRHKPPLPVRVCDPVIFYRLPDRRVSIGRRRRRDYMSLLADFDDAPSPKRLRFLHCRRFRRRTDRAGGLRTILKPRLSTTLPRTAIGT